MTQKVQQELIEAIALGLAGTVPRSLDDVFKAHLDVKWFGAKGDGVTDDTVAIQKALDYAFTSGGAEIYFPPGRYYRPNSSAGLLVRGNVKLRGAGKRISVIFNNDSVLTARNDLLYSVGQASNVTLEDIGFDADWGTGNFTQRSQLVQLIGDGTGRLEVIRCRFSNSRFMACVGNSFASALAMGNEVYRTEADGLRFTACDNVTVVHNFLREVNDDAIAIHTKDDETSPVQNAVVVSGNRIVDSQGMAILGGKHITITSNSLTRCHVRGIFVGLGTGDTTEGNTAALALNITGNTVTDMFLGTTFFAGSGGTAYYICVASRIPTASGGGFVGQPNGAGAIIQPYPFFYTNNTDAVAPVAGNWLINIADNTCARTLAPVANYSAYGFGTRYGRGGPVDPAITAASLGSAFAQVTVLNHAQNLSVKGNTLWGGGYGVWLQGTSGSSYLSWRDCDIESNQIGNFANFGVRVEGEGMASVKNNAINGDPLHSHAQRLANGKWNNTTAHAAFSYVGAKLEIVGNSVRNVAAVLNGTATDDHTWGNNTFFCDPAVASGFDANNIGIGFFANFPRYGAHQLVIEDGDPASATFGKIKNACLNGANAMPSTGKYVTGHLVRNAIPSVLGGGGSQYIILGWMRTTVGTGHVLNTDWREMRTLTGT